MLHLFSNRKPWFAVKRYGYGAGLPIAWQGWVLLLVYVAAITGLGLLAEQMRGAPLAGVMALIILLTAILILIVKARTHGEWRWRRGD